MASQPHFAAIPLPQYPLYTVLVIDKHGNGRPAAFLLTSSHATEALATFLKDLRAEMERIESAWRPSCVLVDDCNAEINAIGCAGPPVLTHAFTARPAALLCALPARPVGAALPPLAAAACVSSKQQC